MEEKEVSIYFGRLNGHITKYITDDESDKKSKFQQIVKGMNKEFQAEGNVDGYIMMDDIVYCVNPSLKYKKITGAEAKAFRRCVKNAHLDTLV